MKILQYVTDLWSINLSEKTTCQDCGKVFSDEIGLKIQEALQTIPEEKRSLIATCERKFNTEFLLKNHIGRSHAHVNCDICEPRPVS